MTVEHAAPLFNPLTPEFRADPYPTYAAMRQQAPVYHSELGNSYVISRYDDVVHVLKQPNLFSSSAINLNVRNRGTRTIINTDPPLHTNMRNMVNRAFTPRMVADMEPRIREITDGLLERVRSTGEMDLVRDLAIPLPVTVIAEILGVDPGRRADFKRWSNAMIGGDAVTTDAERAGFERDAEEFMAYFEQAIAERRKAPRNDLISALIKASDEDAEAQLTEDDLLAFTALLLIAGNETTTNLLGNAVLALLEQPHELDDVIADRSLVPNVVEEALRYDSPVQFLFRTATEDTTIAGVPVPNGSGVIPVYASGNRDERRFPDPDNFDIRRNTQGHLAFGLGVHFCLGAPLARLEAKVALEELLARTRDLRRADDAPIERVNSLFLRGLKSLPLAFG